MKEMKEELLSDVWQKRFRSIVGSPNWLAISALPEISFRVMILSIQFDNDDVMTDINPEASTTRRRLLRSMISNTVLGKTGSTKTLSGMVMMTTTRRLWRSS
jgi:hypothetical protein